MDPSQVRPYAPETVNDVSYKEMRAFRTPVIETHLTTFYVLLVLILMHLIGVVTTEVRKGGAIISAMFTGRKILSVKPDTGLTKPPLKQKVFRMSPCHIRWLSECAPASCRIMLHDCGHSLLISTN